MSEQERGTDRAGRRRKRFLTPQQKYEIWIQLVRHEATIAGAADRAGVVNGQAKVSTGGQLKVSTLSSPSSLLLPSIGPPSSGRTRPR
jgi:hypothetical protein